MILSLQLSYLLLFFLARATSNFTTLSSATNDSRTITTDPGRYANYTLTCNYPGDFRHPSFCSPPPKDPQLESCFTSWATYLRRGGYDSTKILNSTVAPTVYVWETIQSFGVNSTYTDCTGIPRISFVSPPTTNRTASFSITAWEAVFALSEGTAVYKNSALSQASEALKPQCTFPDAVRDYYCLNLDALRQLGGKDALITGIHPRGEADYYPPPHSLCRLSTGSNPVVEEVILFYWPKNLTTSGTCATVQNNSSLPDEFGKAENDFSSPFIITTNAITFKGRDLYLRSVNGKDAGKYMAEHSSEVEAYYVSEDFYQYSGINGAPFKRLEPSVMTGTWSFTYPTIYLAHRPVSVCPGFSNEDSHWAIVVQVCERVRSAGVISLKPEDVSTIRPRYHSMRDAEYAKIVANGSFSFTNKGWWDPSARSETLPLNFDDLQDPVPASAYYDARMLDCWGLQTQCATITDGTFRPKLRLAPNVWASLFADRVCSDGLVVDPPVAFRRIYYESASQGQRTFPPTSIPTSRQFPDPFDSQNNADSPRTALPGPSIDLNQPRETGIPSNFIPGPTSTENTASGADVPKSQFSISSLLRVFGWYRGDRQPAPETQNNLLHVLSDLFGWRDLNQIPKDGRHRTGNAGNWRNGDGHRNGQDPSSPGSGRGMCNDGTSPNVFCAAGSSRRPPTWILGIALVFASIGRFTN